MNTDPVRLLEGQGHSAAEASAASLLRSLPEPSAEGLDLEAVWSGVRRPKASARWTGWAIATAAATAVALFGVVRWRAPMTPASAPEATLPKAAVVASDDQASVFDFQRARVLLGPNSAVELTSPSQEAALTLTAGRLVAEVAPRAKDERFTVFAGQTRVDVKGTRFEVKLEGGGNVGVRCAHGLVEVSRGGAHWSVPAGSQWHSASANVTSDAQPLDDAPLEATPKDAPKEADVAKPANPAAVAPPAEVAPRPKLARADDDPYAQALALDRRGRHAETAAMLRQIVARRQPNADLALYHLAELERGPLADRARAETDFLGYERDFPQGVLSQEAALSAIELELDRSAFTEALAEMNRFLAAHPDSERASRVHVLRGNVLRTQGRPSDALADYGLASGADRGDALFYSALCQRTLGRGEAEATLREYLKSYPSGPHAEEARKLLGK